ncbi:MAG TPA: hypothetical protein VL156_09340 [Terriglobales bacterium]|jgi:hypothetical protein|nr:hypothetical protein [Terriglobales bacterium]
MIRKLIPGMLLTVLFLTACGSTRPITVSPASADAQNFPNGIVHFKATGVTSPTWCIGTANGSCNGNIASIATIDVNGQAQCLAGHSGTVTILAGSGGQVMNPDGGMQLSHFDSAQLTCP